MKLAFVILITASFSHASTLKSSLAFACDANQEQTSLSLEISSTVEARALIKTETTTYECPLHLDEFMDGRRAQVLSVGYSLSRSGECAPKLPADFAKRLQDTIQLTYYPRPRERALVTYLYRREHVECRLRPIRPLDREAFMKRLRQRPPASSKHEPNEPLPTRTKSKLPVSGRSIQSI